MNVIMIRSNSINPDVRLEKEATTLAGAGYFVKLLGWDRTGDSPHLEKRSGYTIRRITLRACSGGIKVFFYLPIFWILVFFQLLKEDWDIVHASDLDTYPPALLAAKLKRKPIIYDIYDFYADLVPLPKPIRNFVANLDVFLMGFADSIIIVDPSRLRQIGREDGDPGVTVIVNSPKDLDTPEKVFPRPQDAPFTILFAGILIPGRDFESIIEAGKDIDNIHIIFAGFGSLTGHVWSFCSRFPFVTFLGTIPHNEVLQRTLQSDLLFAFYDPGIPNNLYSSPNKLFEAMMCRKPILVNDGTSMAEIVKNENCGIVVRYGDVSAIRQAVLKLRDDPYAGKQLGENGRRAYEQKYGWKIMEDRLLALYKEFQILNKS
jgi:glycosyltransferase involved in cell wall biosynthesis